MLWNLQCINVSIVFQTEKFYLQNPILDNSGIHFFWCSNGKNILTERLRYLLIIDSAKYEGNINLESHKWLKNIDI